MTSAMTSMTVKFSMLAFAAALMLAPAPSFAQSGYDGVMPSQKGGKPSNDVLRGGDFEDSGESGDDAAESDTGVGGGFGTGTGFDDMYAGGDGAKDLYSYVGNEKPTASSKRDKVAAEGRKKRDEMVAKMKANSEKLLQQQKERAWKATHKGQEYPGEEEASDDGSGDGVDTGSDLFGKDGGGDAFGDSGGGGGDDNGFGGDSGGGDGDGGSDY
ncbi:MAG: hypothetical protein IT560_02490 [Alphaproteobacteria bacterium]|nr:hypothetical protein [Alphaproteobacteria bacterium]